MKSMRSNSPDVDFDALGFEEAPVRDANGEVIAWHSVAYDSKTGSARFPFGGGFHRTRDSARKIALAETWERSIFRHIRDTPSLRSDFRVDQFPSTCGFAAGWDSVMTQSRAIAEAIERSAWSRWIDLQKPIFRKIAQPQSWTPASLEILGKFDQVQFWQGVLRVRVSPSENVPSVEYQLLMGVVLGFSGQGVFPGSRVCLPDSPFGPWEHSLIEAWRHQIAFLNSDRCRSADENMFPMNRVVFFGSNASAALSQIPQADERSDWDNDRTFEVDFLRECRLPDFLKTGLHVWRALDTTSIPWTNGDHCRFVY